MIINILAGGPNRYIPNLFPYNSTDTYWVGVDRGVYELLTRNIKPHLAFGDFDSISEEEFLWLKKNIKEINTYPSEKDDTDLEIAINWAIQQKPELIRVFGATGGRIDHLLGNIHLLLKGLDANIEIEMIDTQNMIIVKKPGTYQIQFDPKYTYISFLPVTQLVKKITLKGFKYPLKEHDLRMGQTLCISNELIDKIGTFSFTEGILLMVRSND